MVSVDFDTDDDGLTVMDPNGFPIASAAAVDAWNQAGRGSSSPVEKGEPARKQYGEALQSGLAPGDVRISSPQGLPPDVWIVIADTERGAVARVYTEQAGDDYLWESAPLPYHPGTDAARGSAFAVAEGAALKWARDYLGIESLDRETMATEPTTPPVALEPEPDPQTPRDKRTETPSEAPTTAPALRATVDLLRQRIAEAERRLDRLDWFAHSHPIAEIRAGRVHPVPGGNRVHVQRARDHGWLDDA